MPRYDTRDLGRISYELESTIQFPAGVPGFEERRDFVAVTVPNNEPLVFLQSLEDPALCFITLPALAIDAQLRLSIDPEDLRRLDLATDRQPLIGEEVLCLAIISLRDTGPTVNLMAPVVVNLRNRKAVQAVMPESGYSHRHTLAPDGVAAC
jgi:flagellar assembly factor FliW